MAQHRSAQDAGSSHGCEHARHYANRHNQRRTCLWKEEAPQQDQCGEAAVTGNHGIG